MTDEKELGGRSENWRIPVSSGRVMRTETVQQGSPWWQDGGQFKGGETAGPAPPPGQAHGRCQ